MSAAAATDSGPSPFIAVVQVYSATLHAITLPVRAGDTACDQSDSVDIQKASSTSSAISATHTIQT